MARSSYDDDDNKAEARQIERRTEAEQVRDRVRAEHDALIDALPYGSLGIVGEVDMSTPGTWCYSDAEGPRNGDIPISQFAEEFLGIKPGSQQSITNSEKRLLKEQSRLEIDGGFVGDSPINRQYREGITPEKVQQQQKEDRAFQEAATGLWAEYAFRHPEQAQDRAGARAAINSSLKIAASLGGS